jgi:hypothetical protein
MKKITIPFLAASILMLFSYCGNNKASGVDAQVTSLGTVEVTAELVQIKGELIDRPLYDYVFIFKYKVLKVHRGKINSEYIYVGHYNPLKARSEVSDANSGKIGGNVKTFQGGDIHRMALDTPLDNFYMGGIVNRYFEEMKGAPYWALWTNQVVK